MLHLINDSVQLSSIICYIHVLFPNFKYQVILSRIILVTKIQISADFVFISQVMHIQLRLRLVTNLFRICTYFSEFQISSVFVKNHCSYKNTDISRFCCHIANDAYAASIKTCHKFFPNLYVLIPNSESQVFVKYYFIAKIQSIDDILVNLVIKYLSSILCQIYRNHELLFLYFWDIWLIFQNGWDICSIWF